MDPNNLTDRAAIADCIHRYCRGVDRADWELVKSSYWPDAVDDHGMFVGPAADFVGWLTVHQQRMVRSTHLIGNTLVQIDGSTAESESYFSAYATIDVPDTGIQDHIVTGRYLDRFERRQGSWKISARQVVYDWYRIFADTQFDEHVPYAPNAKSGRSSRADVSYEFLSVHWHGGIGKT